MSKSNRIVTTEVIYPDAGSLAARLERLPHLSEAERAAVGEFCRRVLAALPDAVQDIVLYGSKARGDAHPESDVDLLVVLRRDDRAARELVREIAIDILHEREVHVSVIVSSAAELHHQAEIGMPFVRNVAADGLPLVGKVVTVGKGKPRVVAEKILEEARKRLTDARVLFARGSWKGTISKAYYVMVPAADAVLAMKRITPRSHVGTGALFRHHFVRTGLVGVKYSRWLGQALDHRIDADYNYEKEFGEADARLALERAEEFLAMAERLVAELAAEEAAEATDNAAAVEDDKLDGDEVA